MSEPNPYFSDLFLSHFTDGMFGEMQKNNDPDTSNWMTSGRSKTNPEGEDQTWWMANGPEMVARWHKFRQEHPWPIYRMPDGTPGIEIDILTEVAGWPVKAIIDRLFWVNDLPVLVDIKTGKREPEDLLQLGVYRCALQAAYGIKVDFGAYWMARTGKLSPIHDIRRYTPALLSHYIRQFKDGVKHRIFLPHISSLCRACAMRKFCNAYGGESAEIDPDNERSKTDG